MIKVAVCAPSDKLAAELEDFVLDAARILPEPVECDVYMSGEDFEGALLNGEVFGIVYMCLDMGDIDGVALGKKLRVKHGQSETLLIYLAESEVYPEHIFEVQPFLLIRLPPEKNDFAKKMYAAIDKLQQTDGFFTFKKGGVTYQIMKRNIICIESDGRDVIIYSAGRDMIRYREAIKNVQEKLASINFVRPHQSFIVNLDHVEEYHSDSIALSNKMTVPISELKMRETKKAVLNFWEYRNK